MHTSRSNPTAAATASASVPVRSRWIISPTWDLAFIVLTPLAIIPLVLLLERHVFTPAQIILFVTSFATLGHHLPGFMRAYGDRELFNRYRWRFLVVPPLALATALAFVPPPSWSARLNIPWQAFHGLDLLLLLWGTWHGLMQTFGFMRIYDMKRGIADRTTARLDFWLCVLLFTGGVVFSDARVFGLMNVAWQTGLPILDVVWLSRTRMVVGVATVAVLAAYLVNIARQSRRAQGVSWAKVLLALSTGAIYWYSGRISTNLVIGIAMFEIFHAVQYYAIVWSYNRRLADRAGARFGLLGFMFREKWSMLGLYLAAIAAFGSIRYLAGAPDDEDTLARHADLFAILTAVFSASTLLHFYFDGFIWKVSDRATAANLEVSGSVPLADRYTPALMHLGKWAAFYGVAFGLMFLQYETTTRAEAAAADDVKKSNRRQVEPYTAARGAYLTGDRQIVEALAQWTPNLPESQLQAARVALESGDYDTATRLAQRAAAMRPRAHEALAMLGQAQLYGHQFPAAADTFRRAIALEPARWRYQLGLAQALDSDGQTAAALDVLQAAADTAPDEPELVGELIAMYEREAERCYRARHYSEARATYARLLKLAPDRAGDRFRLGQIELDQQDYRAAAATFRQITAETPQEPKARMLLGVALMELNEAAESEQQLREALRLAPNDPDPHYNLALLLLRAGRTNEARDQVLAAQQLGLRPSPEVLRAVGL